MPNRRMNFGKCYRKVGRLTYLNLQKKHNRTTKYDSEYAMGRLIRRRVGRYAVNQNKKQYGPLFGVKKTMFDKSCKRKNIIYYKANNGNASDFIFWKKNYGGSINLTISGKNCNVNACDNK